MSNLKLPPMTYAALLPRLRRGYANIAYVTVATRYANVITIRQHGNIIAQLDAGGNIYVTNAGWNTPTTRTRIHKILVDNGLDWGVTQIDFTQYLVNRVTGEKLPEFSSANFDHEGTLTHFNSTPKVESK